MAIFTILFYCLVRYSFLYYSEIFCDRSTFFGSCKYTIEFSYYGDVLGYNRQGSVSFLKKAWHKEQVSVHCSILKHLGEKSYHRYFSDIKTHDQAFF